MSGQIRWSGRGGRAPRGMTLVEVLMSFAILVVGLVSIFSVLFTGTKSHQRAIRETESAMVASSILAELRAEFAKGRKRIPEVGAPTDFIESKDFPGYRYRVRVIPLEAAKPGEERIPCNEYFVRVTVLWRQQGEDLGLDYDTIMFLNEPREKRS